MIKRKDLINLKHVGRECVGFDYVLCDEQDKQVELCTMRFKYMSTGNWCMQIVTDRTEVADSQVYNVLFVMPKRGMSLELITETALLHFLEYFRREIDDKVMISVAIQELFRGK